MKKLAMTMIVLSFLIVGSVGIASISTTTTQAEFNLEALFNQSGEFRGCPYSGSDCRKVEQTPQEPTEPDGPYPI